MIKTIASGSKGNCYIIQAGEDKLLLECGIAWKGILKGLDFNLKDLRGCIVTHKHTDHVKSIKEVVKNGIKVYGPEDVFMKNNLQGNRKAINLKDKDIFKISNFTILAFKNNHSNNDGTECTCLGYLIQHPKLGKILFSTDSYYIKYKFKNVDHILIECNYSEKVVEHLEPYRARLFKSHMSLETLKEFLKATNLSNTKDITLIHISENNGEPEYFKEEIEKLTGIPTYIAARGLKI